MWLTSSYLGDLEAAYLMAIGRAICLAQNFELNCKNLLLFLDMGQALTVGRVESLEDYFPYGEKLLRTLLGAAIKKIGAFSFVSSDHLETLTEAKDARNYFAHEAALPVRSGGVSWRPKGQVIIDELPTLERKVEALAMGDDLVSGWLYEIEEKQSRRFVQTAYVENIQTWVLASLAEVRVQFLLANME
jgi:hypothetical protein